MDPPQPSPPIEFVGGVPPRRSVRAGSITALMVGVVVIIAGGIFLAAGVIVTRVQLGAADKTLKTALADGQTVDNILAGQYLAAAARGPGTDLAASRAVVDQGETKVGDVVQAIHRDQRALQLADGGLNLPAPLAISDRPALARERQRIAAAQRALDLGAPGVALAYTQLRFFHEFLASIAQINLIGSSLRQGNRPQAEAYTGQAEQSWQNAENLVLVARMPAAMRIQLDGSRVFLTHIRAVLAAANVGDTAAINQALALGRADLQTLNQFNWTALASDLAGEYTPLESRYRAALNAARA
jgi:hypothetical protein